MPKLYNPLSITTIKAALNLVQQRFIGFDGSYCNAGAKALGVSDIDTEQGQNAPIATIGTLLVECGGTIDIGDAVASDSDGKAIKFVEPMPPSENEEAESTPLINGYSRDTGSAGDVIRIERGI